jgi:hypothetical protein
MQNGQKKEPSTVDRNIVGIKEALERLIEGVQQVPHVYRPSTETFAELDIQKVARELDLEAAGRANGEKSRTQEDSRTLDETEQRILEYIKREQRGSHGALHDQVQLYGERLAALDFEGALAVVESSAIEAAAEFRVQARQGKDLLHSRRRDLQAMEQWRDTYQKQNGLKRPAIFPDAPLRWLKIGFLILLLAAEMAINGNFLARGSSLGLVGGALEALSFATLNILGTAIIGFFGIRQLTHRSFARKLVGIVSLCFYAAFAICLNLALAHYREVAGSGISLDVASQAVIGRLAEHPLTLAELKSWILFALGIGFSLAALIDVLGLDDPYPGYGRIERRLRALRDLFVETKAFVITSLAEIRDEATQAMNEARRDLGVRRNEFDAIADHRQRLVRLFKNHEDHLDETMNRLFAIYRSAYAAALERKPPGRFAVRVMLKRTPLEEEIRSLENPDKLYQAVDQARSRLAENLQVIHSEYEMAAKELQQLDDLIPSGHLNAAPETAAA